MDGVDHLAAQFGAAAQRVAHDLDRLGVAGDPLVAGADEAGPQELLAAQRALADARLGRVEVVLSHGGTAPVRRAHIHTWVHGLPLKMKFRASGLYISVIPPLLVGALVGFMAAIMGVGGGFIMVPAMIYLLGMPTKVVVGTSLFQIIFVTAFTTLAHAITSQTVDILLAFLLIIGGVIGAQIGATGKTCKGCHEVERSVSLRQDKDGWNTTLTKMVGFGMKAKDADLAIIAGWWNLTSVT